MLIASSTHRNSINKKLSHQLIWIGFFLLPFENLIIAPSAGWPAISPVFFLLALLFTSRKKVIDSKSLKWTGALLTLSCIGWLISTIPSEGNRNFIRDISSSIPPLIMGYAFYQSVQNLVLSDKKINHASLTGLINALILGSKIALCLSIIILLLTQISRSSAFIEILSFILKRNQESLRFSFIFAEPSFVSVHIIGVLIPITWLTWRLNYRSQTKSLLGIIFSYTIISIFFVESARFFLDIAFAALILGAFRLSGSLKKLTTKNLTLLCTTISLAIYLVVINPAIIENLTSGRVSLGSNLSESINSDPSLASRYFRTDAVFQALIQNPHFILTGVGYGNVGLLVDLGYKSARQNFTSPFTKEVDEIYIEGSGPNIFNMYARFIGEFGLVAFIVVLFCLYDKKVSVLFFITLWCYLQFDSYAFYSIWIYLITKSIINTLKQSPFPASIQNTSRKPK